MVRLYLFFVDKIYLILNRKYIYKQTLQLVKLTGKYNLYTVNYKRGIGSYKHKRRLSDAHTHILLLLRTGRVDKGVSEIILFELTLGILNFEIYCFYFM